MPRCRYASRNTGAAKTAASNWTPSPPTMVKSGGITVSSRLPERLAQVPQPTLFTPSKGAFIAAPCSLGSTLIETSAFRWQMAGRGTHVYGRLAGCIAAVGWRSVQNARGSGIELSIVSNRVAGWHHGVESTTSSVCLHHHKQASDIEPGRSSGLAHRWRSWRPQSTVVEGADAGFGRSCPLAVPLIFWWAVELVRRIATPTLPISPGTTALIQHFTAGH